MLRAEVNVLETPEEVTLAAASRFARLATEAVTRRGRFAVALAGGSTPARTYELLASDQWKNRIDWQRVHVFFGDERCVPPTDPDSNYRMAYEALLSRVGVPRENVRRMRGEEEPRRAAEQYEGELRAFFGETPWPRFDLVMLGMGDDGHTASLFPGTTALRERSAWVAANRVEQLNAHRLTLTVPVFNHAAHVLFTVTGAAKAGRLREVLAGPREPQRLPAQMIVPRSGTLEWLVDRAASPAPPDS